MTFPSTIETERDAWPRFQLAALVFAIGTAIHALDHLRRGQGSISDALNAVGTSGQVAQVVVITLALTHHRLAPRLAWITCLPISIGIATVHWLPRWSELSDPVWKIDTYRPLSYLASTVEIVGALSIGVLGLLLDRQQQRATRP